MRRFINSIPGRLVAKVTALALLMPFFSIVVSTRAEAQFQTLPTWAVVDFVNKAKTGGPEVGARAAEAVALELAKSTTIEVLPQETVNRAIESIGLRKPVTDVPGLLRLGAELRASTIVTGEVVNYRIVSDSGGKRADVLLKVLVRDVASGLSVNGSALGASSSVRAGDVDDMTLLSEALAAGAAQAVREINTRALPTATVLNTLNTSALINQGARTGFKEGMELVVVRGQLQVATAVVESVEPDSAIVRITGSSRGIQPGDRVRAIVVPPDIKDTWNNNGQPNVIKPKTRRGSSDFGQMAVVLGVVAVLLSGNRKSGDAAAASFSAEATMFPESGGSPAVRLSWTRDIFHRGRSQMYSWQFWRSDVATNPVLVAYGDPNKVWDTTQVRATLNWTFFGGRIGGATCDNGDPDDESATNVPGVIPGQPYLYEIQQVYRIASIDLPGGGSTGTTGGTTASTGGTTTGGTTGLTTGGTGATTGGTTGGTGGTTGGTTGAEFCFFVSPRQAAKGFATPLNRPNQVAPASGATVATDENFTFSSVVNPAFPITIEYALQFSSDESFMNGKKIKTFARIQRSEIGILAFVPADYRRSSTDTLLARLRAEFGSSVNQIWWRVGARNVADRPGPAADKSGQRYVFGAGRRMLLPTLPPPPP